jgi:hypothetical protein
MKKVFLLGIMLLATLCIEAATPYCVLSGSTLTFYYDDNRPSSGTTYDLVYSNDQPKWVAKASSVKTVVFHSSFADARPTDGSR